jgi:two-component system sensor kinase FixL
MSGVTAGRRQLGIVTSHDDERVRIQVRDTGTGIPADDLNRVFEPFVTTKPSGVGLGLAICRSIVGSLGGAISGVNNPEGGSTFDISLPYEVRDLNRTMEAIDEAAQPARRAS